MHVRRPLLWLLAAYLLGMGIYRVNLLVVIIIACVAMLVFVFWKIWFMGKKENQKSMLFLWVLPFLFLLGYGLMNRQKAPANMDAVFSAKIQGTVIGRLEMIEEKGQYTLLTLVNNTITVRKPYYNENKASSQYYSKKVIIYTTAEADYKIGNILLVSGQILKFQKSSNPGQFNEYEFYKIRNIDYKVNSDTIQIINQDYSRFHHYLYTIKKKFVHIYQRILPPKDSGIMSAMILGEMALLDDDMKKLYQESGISHILSISGLNVSLLGITLFTLLRKSKMSILPATVISIGLIFSYGVLTNFSVSTNRAVVMLIVRMLADIIGRTYDLVSATALSALIILIQSPMQIYNAGFLLSFGAILGIAVLYPVLSSIFPVKNTIVDAFWLSFSIECITVPIILYFFYEFPLYSLLINMIILPLSSIIVIMAIVAAIIGCFSIPLSIFSIGCVHYVLDFYELVCRTASELPGKTLLTGQPDRLLIITYYLVIIAFILIGNRTKRKCSVLLLCFMLVIGFNPKNNNLKVTFLDVGQGDGIFMEMPSGTTYLIDGGSSDVKKVGEYRLEPFLKASGIWELDYAVVSHTDADHISGLVELMEGMEEDSEDCSIYGGYVVIRHLILPSISVKNEAYKQLIALAESKGIEVFYIQKGDIISDDEVTITCMHPRPDFIFNSSNAYSTVLSLSYKEFDLLLTGDLEADGEELVVNDLKKEAKFVTDYDVLKIAHHGSEYSTFQDFLDIVKPEYAVISCGKDNRYGHPHADLIKRLEEAKSDILITKDSGAIRIETNGDKMIINEYYNEK